jgi:DNA-directed RNA polymerase subunit omega
MSRLEEVLSRALENVNGDLYLLSMIIAKRSEQISNGNTPLIEVTKELEELKPVDLALYELAENKLEWKIS